MAHKHRRKEKADGLEERAGERLGVLEVGGVKALGEPAVNRGEQLAGGGALALALPQARQAGGGA